MFSQELVTKSSPGIGNQVSLGIGNQAFPGICNLQVSPGTGNLQVSPGIGNQACFLKGTYCLSKLFTISHCVHAIAQSIFDKRVAFVKSAQDSKQNAGEQYILAETALSRYTNKRLQCEEQAVLIYNCVVGVTKRATHTVIYQQRSSPAAQLLC